MNLSYNLNIPFQSNKPSVDQPDMLTNTNSIGSWVGIDHYGFGSNTGGQHQACTLIAQAALPGARTSGMGTLYTKQISSRSQLFYSPDTTTNEFQLTRCISTSFSLFSTNVNNYGGAGVAFTGGYTFLPGGMLLQYGFSATTTNNTIIKFPAQFTNTPYSIQLTGQVDDNTTIRLSVKTGSESNTQFQINTNSAGSHFTGVYWIAIGV